MPIRVDNNLTQSIQKNKPCYTFKNIRKFITKFNVATKLKIKVTNIQSHFLDFFCCRFSAGSSGFSICWLRGSSWVGVVKSGCFCFLTNGRFTCHLDLDHSLVRLLFCPLQRCHDRQKCHRTKCSTTVPSRPFAQAACTFS